MIVARPSSKLGLRGVRVGEASDQGPELSRQRSASQGNTEESHVMPARASEELMDAMKEDFEGTQVGKKTRRRVLSEDDLLTQVLPAFSDLASRRWCWQELQATLLVEVHTRVTFVMMVTKQSSHTMGANTIEDVWSRM